MENEQVEPNPDVSVEEDLDSDYDLIGKKKSTDYVEQDNL